MDQVTTNFSYIFSVVPASWHRSSSSSSRNVDVEAQTVSGTGASYVLPTEPEQARVIPARARATTTITSLTSTITAADINAMDEFFGGVTHESRHDSAYPTSDPSSSSGRGNPDLEIMEVLQSPPPYVDAELPAYSLKPTDKEPITLAKCLFKLGFLFPLCWILGAIILVSPLTLPRDVPPSKSREESELLTRIIRAAEVRWAKRCAWALFMLVLFLGFVGSVIGVMAILQFFG